MEPTLCISLAKGCDIRIFKCLEIANSAPVFVTLVNIIGLQLAVLAPSDAYFAHP